MKATAQGRFHFVFSGLLPVILAACGGSGGNGGGGGGAVTYTIGGMVTGLTGSGLVLQNGGAGLAVPVAGAFTFGTGLANGVAYAVSVMTQPSAPTQNCVVTNGSGTVATSNVTNVAVACTTTTFSIGGNVTELTGLGLVLQNNGADDLPVSTSGSFTFANAVASGEAYAVTIKTQPNSPAQTCSVGSGSGTVADANVLNVQIACALHFAYAANAGDDTLSVYNVDSFTGVLTPAGAPVATGESPYAITGSPDKHHVYVVNQVSNNISAYAVDPMSGALTQVAGSPFAAGTDPEALAFDPSGNYLYVANKGSNNLSAYTVNVGSGALTPQSPATYGTGAAPSAVSVDPTGQFVYVANNGGSNDISVFAITAGTGELTPVVGSPFAVGDNPYSLSITTSSLTASALFTANFNGTASTISAFRIDSFTGALTARTGSPFSLAVSHYIGTYRGLGETLFVTTGSRVVGYFLFSGPNGFPNALPDYSADAGTNAYSVTAFNGFIYVCNDGAASVSAYRVDDAGGTLQEVPGSPFPAGQNPDFIAIL